MLLDSQPTWHATMRNELAQILGVAVTELPTVFRGHHRHLKILKSGMDQDVCAAYPQARWMDIKNWLARYTSDVRYLKRLARFAQHRHDLDGRNVEEISGSDRKEARKALQALALAEGRKGRAVLSIPRSNEHRSHQP